MISSQDVYRRLHRREPAPPDPVPLGEDAPLHERFFPDGPEAGVGPAVASGPAPVPGVGLVSRRALVVRRRVLAGGGVWPLRQVPAGEERPQRAQIRLRPVLVGVVTCPP